MANLTTYENCFFQTVLLTHLAFSFETAHPGCLLIPVQGCGDVWTRHTGGTNMIAGPAVHSEATQLSIFFLDFPYMKYNFSTVFSYILFLLCDGFFLTCA